MLITTIIGYTIFKNKIPNYLCSKLKGILLALAFIVIFFYTYTGIIGKSYGFLNIGSFIVAAILGQYYAYKTKEQNKHCYNILSTIILILITTLFIIFTYYPLNINIFVDPITKTIRL